MTKAKWNWNELLDHVKAAEIPVGQTARFVMLEDDCLPYEYEITHTHSIEITKEQYERISRGEDVEDALGTTPSGAFSASQSENHHAPCPTQWARAQRRAPNGRTS